MNVLLFCLLLIGQKVTLNYCTEVAPSIDGSIEELWQSVDSIYDFVQYMPYENKEASEKTIVYLLQDRNNLYIAFRCYTKNRKPEAHLMGGEDFISLYFDTFNNKTTAYFFKVTASGLKEDALILDDGRQFDFSWEGVWYSAVKCFDDRYEVEIKIPFKSIRYEKKTAVWGINFRRSIPINQEVDYWIAPLQKEGLRVSKFGLLNGINPQATGYYLELYPEGVFRYEKYFGEEDKYRPNVSFNLKWDLTSQTTIDATANPDFAQIEADPYTLNLSRYPTYLSEQRPFFVEGSEIFKMSGFDESSDFYQPLKIFYSRMIGKSIITSTVPILGGLKLTTKSRSWQVGLLSVVTDSLETEPKKGYGVFRVKRGIFDNSDIGILFSSAAANRTDYNYAIGCDFAHRFSVNQFLLQSALSNRNGVMGMAISSGFNGFIGNFLTELGIETTSDSFDVSDIGYVPWVGRKSVIISCGPFKEFAAGLMQNIYLAPGFQIIKEPGGTNWSKLLNLKCEAYFRNNWTFALKTKYGAFYEVDTNYIYKDIDLWLWGTDSKTYDVGFGLWCNYSYNYLRNWLGYQGSNYLWFGYYFLSRFCSSIEANFWYEWNPDGKISSITPMATPRLDIRITKDMSCAIFNEFVFSIPNTDFGATDLISNRLGFLFSWNFRPKSWLYIAFNDYREQDSEGRLQLQNRIGAIKAKYLIYF